MNVFLENLLVDDELLEWDLPIRTARSNLGEESIGVVRINVVPAYDTRYPSWLRVKIDMAAGLTTDPMRLCSLI